MIRLPDPETGAEIFSEKTDRGDIPPVVSISIFFLR